jgi:enoyl-CoA hydratase
MDLALACDMRFVGPEGWMQQGWARLGLIPAGGGAFFLERTAPGLIWELIDDQRRLGPQDCERWGLGIAVTPTALDAATARAASLARMGIERRSAYVELTREARWPSEEYLAECADHQAQFIGSVAFQEAAQKILRPRENA